MKAHFVLQNFFITLFVHVSTELSELIELDAEGDRKKFPHNATYLALKEAIKEGEFTINLCDQLIARRDAQG